MDPVNVPAKFEVHSFTRSSGSWDNSGYFKTLDSPWIRRSRSSKVIAFGANRKHACDFLLVRHSNLGPILHRFGDIAGFFVLLSDPTLFHPNVGGVLFPLHQIARVGVSPRISLKLFGREIILELKLEEFQPVRSRYLNVTDGQTDRQTDRQTMYCGITVLCVASRGKNVFCLTS